MICKTGLDYFIGLDWTEIKLSWSRFFINNRFGDYNIGSQIVSFYVCFIKDWLINNNIIKSVQLLNNANLFSNFKNKI